MHSEHNTYNLKQIDTNAQNWFCN